MKTSFIVFLAAVAALGCRCALASAKRYDEELHQAIREGFMRFSLDSQ